MRNLTAAEIVAQVQIARDDLGDWHTPMEGRQLTNIVFMGMGEPLYNLPNVAAALDIISDNEGIAISRRRITVSTSGVVPELKALGETTGAMLAISLHATRDELRDQLVPINKRYPIAQLMAAIRAYPGLSNAKRVTFEYVMLKGVNDTPADARALVKLIAGIPAKINLIPFNPWPGAPYQCSDRMTIDAFAGILKRAGYASPVRRPRGRDILAACGQLKSESEKLRASERRRQAAAAATTGELIGARVRRLGKRVSAHPAARGRGAGDPGRRRGALRGPVTPHREIQLIREGNAAAAVSFGGVLVGIALPLAFALAASTSVLDIALWGATTIVVQLALFWLVDLMLRGLPQRIKQGEVAAAALLVGAKLAVAAILAAAVSG